MSQRLPVEHEVLPVSDGIVDVEIFLTEKILVKVELLKVPSEAKQRRGSQQDASELDWNSQRTRSTLRVTKAPAADPSKI